MLEINGYEPLAEIEFSLTGSNIHESIYCLCSRVIISLENYCDAEDGICDVENICEGSNKPKTLCSEVATEESVVRFFNSSTESPPPVRTLKKKEHDEAVSCYCSASHYSTDEHDSLRESSILHHSDSGADLSESSRDLDWEKYWNVNGERLIWESWISKYGDHIDPNYTHTNESNQDEETSFFIQVNEESKLINNKTTFTGVLDNYKENNCDLNNVLQKNEDSRLPPKLYITDEEEVYRRRLSDISESVKSDSIKSEGLNFDEEERLRLGGESRCSGSSVPLTSTTDSMTNVTRMTLSSSDSSYSAEDSSVRSSSLLSSSDSASSADQQWQLWQQVWLEHFNDQYLLHYKEFSEKYHKNDIVMENEIEKNQYISATTESEQLDPKTYGKTVDKYTKYFADTVDVCDNFHGVDETSIAQVSLTKEKKKVIKKRRNSSLNNGKVYYDRKINDSVGYLLQNLHTMSVMPTDLIQEEDEIDNTKGQNVTTRVVLDAAKGVNLNSKISIEADFKSDVCMNQSCENFVSDSFKSTDVMNEPIGEKDSVSSICCDVSSDTKQLESLDINLIQDSDMSLMQNTLKRSHGSDIDEPSIDRAKSAFDLMGFVFQPDDTTSKQICKADVFYKKRHIRYQNRGLRLANLTKSSNNHIYFDDNDMPLNNTLDKVKEFLKENANEDLNENGKTGDKKSEVFSKQTMTTELEICNNSYDNIKNKEIQNKSEIEEFSEKDDSSDEDIFFSAEENDFEVSTAKKDSKSKTQKTKKKKRKQLKKKLQNESVRWPQEFENNQQLRKYWHKRYSLFSKFDEGIKLDEESWYSVTPEKVSAHIAERSRCDLIIDGFCGAGGNTIQFAFTCERVLAIDIDPKKIELARHNAQIYGVEDRIEFIVGDFFELAPSLRGDVVFLSPPWGGPNYTKNLKYSLNNMKPINGTEMYKTALRISENIVFYLPRNVDVHQLVECAGPAGSIEVEQNFLGKSLIAVTAYFGELIHQVFQLLKSMVSLYTCENFISPTNEDLTKRHKGMISLIKERMDLYWAHLSYTPY